MAIEVDGKVYRNLPEQVEENANNIQWLLTTIQSFGNVMRYCGSVATYADLPTEDLRTGDVYNVLDTGNNYAWDGEAWDEISSIVDLSGYVTKIGSPLPYYELDDDDNLITFVQDHPEAFEKLIVIKIRNIDSDHPLLAFFGGVPEDDFIYTIWDANLNAIYKGGTAQSFFTLTDALNDPEYYATTTQIEHMANKWVGAYVGDETAFTSNMAVGDTVVESTGGQFLINEITFSGGSLSKVVLVGLEDNANPVVHTFESGAWSSKDYEPNGFGFKVISPSSLVLSSTELSKLAESGLIINTTFTYSGRNYVGATLLKPSFFNVSYWGIAFLAPNNYRYPAMFYYSVNTGNRQVSFSGEGAIALNGVASLSGANVVGSAQYATLATANIGAVTSTQVGSMYRNNIAISGTTLNTAIDVRVKMSNGAVYPVINNGGSELVIFNGVDFVANSITVTTVYYKIA